MVTISHSEFQSVREAFRHLLDRFNGVDLRYSKFDRGTRQINLQVTLPDGKILNGLFIVGRRHKTDQEIEMLGIRHMKKMIRAHPYIRR